MFIYYYELDNPNTCLLMEVAFTFCLGKTKPATFWRILFITTMILSIIGLKVLG